MKVSALFRMSRTSTSRRKTQIDTLAQEVDSLKKQLQSAPATVTDEERATRLKNIDTKEKQLNRDAEDAQTAYNADLQEAYGKVAAKVSVTLKDYVAKNGFTLLLDVSNQQSNVMWAVPSTDVTQAVVTAYNTILRGCCSSTIGSVRTISRSSAPRNHYAAHDNAAKAVSPDCNRIAKERPRAGFSFDFGAEMCAQITVFLWKNLWIASAGRSRKSASCRHSGREQVT